MAEYRIYRFDGGSHVEMAEWIKAQSDEDAIRETQRIGESASMCELWQGNRLVMSLRGTDGNP